MPSIATKRKTALDDGAAEDPEALAAGVVARVSNLDHRLTLLERASVGFF